MMYTLSGSLLAASLVLHLLDRGRFVEAQTTQAVCTSAHAWMSNSKKQNPCLVAAYLHLPCRGGQNSRPTSCLDGHLQSDIHIFTPTANVDAMTQPSQYYLANNDACQCNMISYALIEACQNCQFDNGTTVTSYSRYSLNCTTQNKGYPETIPVGTAVPAWAYQDVSANDYFNLTVAFGVAAKGLPDATASISAGSSTSDIATRSATATATVADSPTTRAPSASSSASASVSPSAGASSSSTSWQNIVGTVFGVPLALLGAIALGSLLFSLFCFCMNSLTISLATRHARTRYLLTDSDRQALSRRTYSTGIRESGALRG
ncbi:hypothetical protein C8T65DRAFT_172271 [Cerioporus squamosus]|nr:hypothetical protein C8T65DRAFT_172271 [Cerioporus squamosus]